MNTKSIFILFLVSRILVSANVMAQGGLEDYQRAERLNGEFQNKVYEAPERFNWNTEGSAFVYSMQTSKGVEFVKVDAKTKRKTLAFDQTQLASALSNLKAFSLMLYPLSRSCWEKIPMS